MEILRFLKFLDFLKIKYIFLHDKTIFSNQIFKNALNYVSRVLDNYLEYIQTTRYHSASDS